MIKCDLLKLLFVWNFPKKKKESRNLPNKFQYSKIKMRNKNKIFFFNFHPLINNSISKLVLICQCKKKLQWDN